MKRLLSVFLCIMMAGTLLPAGALALEDAGIRTVPEWAVDDGGAGAGTVSLQASFPAKYDLRSEGLVTPVKLQNPWGSCWAFGGIAAAETSILSTYGSTYEKSKLDLSERHLTWFSLQPVTEDVEPSQVGEGLYPFDPSVNAPFNTGGATIFVTSLFSHGVGPIMEEDFPYRGKDGTTNLDDYNADPEATTRAMLEPTAESMGLTVDEFLQQRAIANGQSVEEVLASYEEQVKVICETGQSYSGNDDWSIPKTNADGGSNRLINAGVVLKDGNILPTYWLEGRDDAPNPESVNAIKQELLNGHGVSILYYADQTGTYTESSDAGGVMYNQYIDDVLPINHAVCIVGWNDDYAADNFKKEPLGNGAWIVKNSWGSTKEACIDDLGNLVNRGEYGIKDENGAYTGYFYLSYYDRSINSAETMEFSSSLGSEQGFYTLAYDYMPASALFYVSDKTEAVQSAANVFQIDRPMKIKSMSAQTSETNMRVTFAIYLLNDGAQDPADGELIYRTSRNFEYGGFHRLDLDTPIRVEAGSKVSVVTTASEIGDNGSRLYSVSANRGLPEQLAKLVGARYYAKAVVNPGESFVYSGGQWEDWSGLHDKAQAYNGIFTEVDNFSIKLYAEAAEPSITDLWVGDSEQVTAAGEIAGTGGTGTAELSFDDNGLPVLTLTDFTYSGAGHSFDPSAGDSWNAAICYTGSQPLTVKLEGGSNLSCTGDFGIGLYTVSAVWIEGDDDSSLFLQGSSRGISGEVVVSGANVSAVGGKDGISGSSLTISGGTVIAIGEDVCGVNVEILDISALGDGVLLAAGELYAIDTNDFSVTGTVIGRGWKEPDSTAEGSRLELNDTFSQFAEFKRIAIPSEEKYTLTLDAQNGQTPQEVELWPGALYPLSAPSFTPTGKQFIGWNKEPDGSGMQGGADTSFMIATDTTLYGQWKTVGSSSTGGGGGGAAAPAGNPVTVPAAAASASAHGKVTSSAANAKAGDKVTLTLTPDEGWQAAGVTVTDKNGKEIPVTKNADGTYCFTMPDTAVTVTPVFTAATEPADPNNPDSSGGGDVSDRFTDVSKTAWYHDAVQWAVDKGIMNGVSEDTFAPNDTCTRAMVVTMLWRLAGEPASSEPAPFTDVSSDAWYADAVAWAVETGAVNGVSNASFSPNTPVTREQLAAILYRFAQAQGKGFTGSWMFLLDYPDAADVSDWAGEAMHWMVMHGVITGMDNGTLAPKDNATRAQIATMFMRFCAEMEE